MHFTTFVSLLAVGGAVAAPAARSSKSLGFQTSIPMPTLPGRGDTAKATPSSSSEYLGGLAEVLRRQEAPANASQPSFRSFTAEQDAAAAEAPEPETTEEADKLDAFLATFDDEDGQFDEAASDEALDTFNSDFEKRQADSALDAYLDSLDGEDQETSDSLLDDYHEALDGKSTTSAAPTSTSAAPAVEATSTPAIKEAKAANATSEEHAPAEPEKETAGGAFDVEKLIADAKMPKNETSPESAPAKNETATEPKPAAEESETATEPEPKPVAEESEASSAAPEPTTAPESSGTLDGLTGGLPIKRQVPELPEVPEIPTLDNVSGESIKRQAEDLEEGVTTPAVEEQSVSTPALDEKNVTASAANETASEGFHGINKKLNMLKKIPIGLKARQAPEDSEGAPTEAAGSKPTGGKHAAPETKQYSPLDKFLVSLSQPAGPGAPSKPADESNATAHAGPSQEEPETQGAPTETEESSPLVGLMGEKPEAPSAGGPPASGDAPAESSEAAGIESLMGKRQVTEEHQSFVADTDTPAPAPAAKSPVPEPEAAGLDGILEDLALA